MTKHFVACSFIQAAGKGCAVHSHLASHSVHVKVAKQFATKLVLTFPDIDPRPTLICAFFSCSDRGFQLNIQCGCSARAVGAVVPEVTMSVFSGHTSCRNLHSI